MSDAKPVPLSYARARLPWRTWVKRLVVLGWLVLTGYLLYDKWNLWVRLQYAMLKSQQQCLQFVQPPDTVVYDDDPARAQALLLNRDYRPGEIGRFSGGPTRNQAICKTPADVWHKYRVTTADLTWWDERSIPQSQLNVGVGFFGGLFAGDGSIDQFTIFVHERQNPARQRRLVEVTAYLYDDGSIDFDATVMSAVRLWGRPQELTSPQRSSASDNDILLKPAKRNTLRLFAPQPDPADEARFTIRFEDGAGAGIVEGRLTPDDQVAWSLQRDDAAK